MAARLHRSIHVKAMRKLGVMALALGAAIVAVSPSRRALVAQKLAQSRRFVSKRIVDRDARKRQSLDRWDDDGGAKGRDDHAAI